ncbi:mucin-5AC-like isoform X3 [Oncorhynchus tshawytscha]|uniref:mucin-5AC-like isoform X3 n=1 Tax=Oncorhynchus tshawytscha TaxID=74940 RepID=UPI001C3C9F65|nr:mucin-5AC-like isoform X3 [Oncorhynchus tshawytscha]
MTLFIPDMAGRLFLLILLFDTFQYLKAKDLPQLTVSSTVIRETESVQLSCETPPSLPVSHCYFYIEGRKNLPDSSCTQTITGTELLKRADQTFPDVVKVTCYYAVRRSHTSPLSDPVSVTVLDPKPDITVHLDEDFTIICLIHESLSPDTTCSLYVGEESQPSFTAPIKKRKATSASGQQFCQFTPKHSDLISRLQSMRRKEVSCDYRLSSGPNSLSPRSDGHSFAHLVGVHISDPTTIQTPSIAVGLTPGPRSTLPPSTTASPTEVLTVTSTLTPDTTVRPTTSLTSHLTPSTAVNPTSGLTSPLAPSTAVNPTSDPTDTPTSPTERGQSSTDSVVNSNSQKRVWEVQLWQAAVCMASGVGVFLMGLTAVCLCRRTKKTNSLRPTSRQDDHRQCDLVMGAMSSAGMLDSRDAGIYSLITFVPSTFLHSGPVQQSANEDADSENAGVYSLITSVPSTSLPLGPFEGNGKSSENDNSDTYHVYSSIPDRPATSAQPDGFYSLLQTH